LVWFGLGTFWTPNGSFGLVWGPQLVTPFGLVWFGVRRCRCGLVWFGLAFTDGSSKPNQTKPNQTVRLNQVAAARPPAEGAGAGLQPFRRSVLVAHNGSKDAGRPLSYTRTTHYHTHAHYNIETKLWMNASWIPAHR